MSVRWKEKCSAGREKIKAFFLKAEIPLLYIGVAIAATLLRVTLFGGRSNDFNSFLLKWYTAIQEEGAIHALGRQIGDYTPAYFYVLTVLTWIPVEPLYAIKAVSCIFDVLLAVFVALCVKEGTGKKYAAFASYCVVLLLPSVFLNSAAWAQCDSIFTAFCVLSVYLLMKNRNISAVIVYGVAFSFKLQAIFLAPLFAVLWFKKKIPLWSPLLVVGVYFLFCVPSWLCGRSLWSLLTIYFGQAGEYSALTLNAPSFIALFGDISEYHRERVSAMLVVLAFTVTGLLIYVCARHAKWSKECFIDFGFLFSLVVPFLLPHMHERYFYLATVFSVIYAFLRPKRLHTVLLSEFCSLYVICRYLYSINYLSLQLVALAQLVNVILLLCALRKEYLLPERTIEPLC